MENKFIELLTEAVEAEDKIHCDTRLDTLDWDSISQLTFAAMLQDELKLSISATDFYEAETVQNLLDAAKEHA